MGKKKTVDKGVFIVVLLLIFIGAIVLMMRMLLSKDCPQGDFSLTNKSPKVNELVTFSFENQDAKSWEWDYGDSSVIGTHSTETHIYTQPGTYTVRLRTNNSADCEKIAFIEVMPKEIIDEYKVEKILPKPEIAGPKTAYAGTPVTFKETSGIATSWEWFFSETGKVDSRKQNPTYTFREPGQKKVSLIINGDSEIARFDIKINPKQFVSAPIKKSGTAEPIKQKAPQINEKQFKSMLKLIAEREITSEDFDKYINGYFSMSIKVNGKIVEFGSYLKRLGITGEFNVRTIKLKKDQYGFVNDIEITE